MSKKNDPFKSVTIRSRKAKKFLEKLDETHERWKGEVWVFRGQNDATWELKPSLFRDWDKDTYGSYEIALIDNFIRNANVANLPIPNNSLDYYIDEAKPTLRTLQGEKGEITYDFSHAAFAIARHSGIPARLLDFTYNPLIAAYFAANIDKLYEKLDLSSEIKAKYFDKCLRAFKNTDAILEIIEKYLADPCVIKITEPKNIVVWAIRVRDLKETTFQLLDHPYTQILPLRSQMGVFLCDTDSDEEKVQKGKSWTSFNAKLATLVKTKSIYKLTLPFSEIPDLQILLAQKRIYPMFIQPSYEEVAKMTLARMALRIRSHKKSHKENKE